MAAGMLTVVNPRRRRRRKNARRGHAHARRRTTRRRRRHSFAHVAHNPVRRRRRRNTGRRRHRAYARRRHHNPRRRRHRNPSFGGMSFNPMKIATGVGGAVLGFAAARALANGVTNTFMKGQTVSVPVKIGLELLVGIAGGWLVTKFGRQKALGAGLAAGGVAVAAADIYTAYIEPQIKKYAPALGDYTYGSLSDWPQLGNWAPQNQALSSYTQGTLSGNYDGGAYSDGAYQ